MKKINNIFNTANKSLFAIGDTSRRSTPDSSGQRRILLSSCRGPISPLARGVPARAGCRKFGVRFAALVALFVATPSFAEPTELDKKTVASKAYVDTKQDIIETDQVVLQEGLGGDPDVHVPALVSFGTPDDNNGTDGLLGNKVGILGVDTIDTMGLALFDFSDNTEVMGLGNMDSFVPTVRVVANELSLVQGSILDILETVMAIRATLPTGTAGTVVTYNGVNATTGVQEFGERAVYDPANAYNAQNDATKLATMASVKYECAGYEAGHENDPDYCWLWALPN